MGRTEKNILGKNAPVIIDLLKKAYCDEMQIFHYFWYIGINMEGIGLVTYAPAQDPSYRGINTCRIAF